MKKQLGLGKILILALGQLGLTLLLSTMATYTLRFFIPTESTPLPLLLPIGIIGIIQGFSIAFDCLIDPFIAHLGDNSRNPRGKRTPFMRKAALPAGLFCLLVFFVPFTETSWVNVVWVLVMLLLYCASRSFYDVNLRALIPEILPDTFKRVRYHTVVSIYATIGSLLAAVVPTVVVILHNNGMALLESWRFGLIVLPVVGCLLMLIASFSIRETDYTQIDGAATEQTRIWPSLKGAFSNKLFVIFMLASMLLDMSVGIFTASLLFVFDLLLNLEATAYTLALLVVTLGSLLLYVPIVILVRRVGKKRMMQASILCLMITFLLIFLNEPVVNLLGPGLVQPDSPFAAFAREDTKSGAVILLIIISVLFAYPQAVGGAVGSSMYSDIAQYDKVKTGHNRIGMYMAVSNVIGQLPSTLVPAIVGLVIYIGSTNAFPTAQGTAITAAISVCFCIAALIIYHWYDEKKVFAVIIPEAERLRSEATKEQAQSE